MEKLYFIKDIKKTNTTCKSYDKVKSYVDTGSVQNGKIVNLEDYEYKNKPSRANVCVKKGDVLFAKMQNSIKVIVIDDTNCDYIYSTGFYCFSDKRINSNYLKYYLQSSVFNIEKDKRCTGSTQKAINDDGMKQIFIFVPSLSEQEKIVEELDLISSAISENEKRLELYNEMISAKFNEMFGNCIENTKKFKTEKLNKIAPVKSTKHIITDNIWLLGLEEVESNTGKILNYIYTDKVGSSTFGFTTDNILYSKCRPNLNKVVMPTKNGFCTSEMLPLLPDKKYINREFLCYLLRSEEFVTFACGKTKGAKMPRMDVNALKGFNIPLPNLTIQKEFADFVNLIEKNKKETQNKINYYTELLNKQMSKYFEQED